MYAEQLAGRRPTECRELQLVDLCDYTYEITGVDRCGAKGPLLDQTWKGIHDTIDDVSRASYD